MSSRRISLIIPKLDELQKWKACIPKVQFSGSNGPDFDVRSGDVVVIPAGAAHKNLGSTADFQVVGAYPANQHWDMNYGKANEQPQTDQNIAMVAKPQHDPLLGDRGPLIRLWQS